MKNLEHFDPEAQAMVKKSVDEKLEVEHATEIEDENPENYDDGYFHGDTCRLLLLIMLYSIQGVSFGFLGGTLPLMLKKHFSYSEIGIISFGGLPYTIKFMFSPFVDTKYIRWIGRRRTWIIPGQLIAAYVLYGIGGMYEKLSEEKELYWILIMFTLVFLALAFQDIAVDGWAITIVKKKNLANSASGQLLGLSIGSFFGTTIYLAFNSVDFGNRFIYNSPRETPLLNVENFLKGWSCGIIFITAYIGLFQNEKNDRQKVHENDQVTSIAKIIDITKSILSNSNMRQYLFFIYMSYAFSSFNSLVGTTYLLDSLKYEQEKLSLISFINFPIGLITSVFIGKYIFDRPLHQFFIFLIFTTLGDLIFVNVLFYNFESLKGLKFDLSMIILNLITGFGSRVMITSQLGFANKTSNIAIASTQITLFNSLSNLMGYIPNIYSFVIVDYFGLYWPNFLGSVLNIGILFFMKPMVNRLEKTPKEQWFDYKKLQYP